MTTFAPTPDSSEQNNAPSTAMYGVVLAIISYVLFSVADGLIKELGQTYHVSQILFFSYAFSCMPITVYLATTKATMSLRPKNIKWVSIRCLAAFIGGPTYYYAFAHLNMTEAYVIVFSAPAMITLLAIPILGERIGIYRSVALILGFLGVLVVLNPSDTSHMNLGHVSALVGTFCAAISAVAMRKVRNEESMLTMSIYPTLAILSASMVMMPENYIPTMPLGDMMMMIVLGFALVVASYILVMSYTYAEASVVAPLQYSQMVWGILMSVYIFEETMPSTVYYGLPLIIASGLVILWRESTRSRSKDVVTKTRWRGNMILPLLNTTPPRLPGSLPEPKK